MGIVVVIVFLLVLTIFLLNGNGSNNSDDEIVENTTSEDDGKPNDGGLVMKTEDEVRNDDSVKIEELPEEVASKMSEPDKLYGDIKMYIYNNPIFSFDELVVGQYNVNDDVAVVEYFVKKDGKVSQRILVTINLTDNTYTIKHFQ